MNYSICTSNDSLARLLPGWRQRGLVGLDTEFIRTDTFYPIPALYQLTHLEDAVLLDVLAIDAWQALAELLNDSTIVKVMHACAEDMEVIEVHLDVHPLNVFDTQLAHAFVSERFSISYAGLVEEIVAVKLPKHSTRSNWLRRPLSEEQLQYAAEDVQFLLPLYRNLREKLIQKGRLQWFEEESAARPISRNSAPDNYYRGMRQARRMDSQQLALLRAITSWREYTAREKDVPRGRVVRDEHLLRLAEGRVITTEDLYATLPPSVARRYQNELLGASRSANDHADDAMPELLESPLTQFQGETVNRMRAIGKRKANELGIAEELLARRRDLESCLRYFIQNEQLPAMYQGWRGDLVAAELLDELQKHAPGRKAQ